MADDESSFALMPCADGNSRKYENPNGVACLLQVKNRLVEPQMDEAEREELIKGWRKAVGRSLKWIDA